MESLNKCLLDIAQHSVADTYQSPFNAKCSSQSGGGCKLDKIVGGPKLKNEMSGGGVEINNKLLEKYKNYPYSSTGVQKSDWFKEYDESNSNSYKVGLQYIKIPKVQYETMYQFLPFRFDSFQHALDHANKYFPELKFKITGSADAPHFYDSNYMKQGTNYSDVVKAYHEKQNNEKKQEEQIEDQQLSQQQSGGGYSSDSDNEKSVLNMDIDDLEKVLNRNQIEKLFEAELNLKNEKKKSRNERKKNKGFVNAVMTGGYSEGKPLEKDFEPSQVYNLRRSDEIKVNKIENFIDNFSVKKNSKVKKL